LSHVSCCMDFLYRNIGDETLLNLLISKEEFVSGTKFQILLDASCFYCPKGFQVPTRASRASKSKRFSARVRISASFSMSSAVILETSSVIR